MTVALLTIGTELTRGEIADANGAWLATELTQGGFTVGAIESVPDELGQVTATLRRLASSYRLVLVTGGLGPTTDDLTAAAAAKAAGVELARDDSTLLAIRRRVEGRGGLVTSGHAKQALVPVGSEILPNPHGTAPGFALQLETGTAFFMPGVPREMRPMFLEQVLPRIRSSAPNNTCTIRLRTYGLGEGLIGQRLDGVEGAFPGVTLGYRVAFPEVDVKVHARAATQTAAHELASRCAAEVKTRVGDAIYGEGDEAFPEIVGRALRTRGWRLAVAESCTGGLIASLLTRYPGASDYLVGAAVTYANSAKTRLLAVSEDTLRGHGAVSAEVAAEMAEGARRVCECDVAIAVTGIAGPSGGTAEKPVGLIYWAVSGPAGTVVRDRVFAGDRDDIQRAASFAVLDLLRRIAAGLPER
ncbi:MAG: CinA family nicotinamide mononucleotide deamidase-related protein [Polyangiaceae bacterium]